MVHRDLKPDNILLESSDLDKVSVKIADFGFATRFDPEVGLELGCGTLQYMAPEIIRSKTYHENVDIWSLGAITFQLFTG